MENPSNNELIIARSFCTRFRRGTYKRDIC